MIFDPQTIALCAVILLLGGAVKGMTGMGLPLIAVGLMSTFLPVKMVLGITIVPVLLSNVWQVYEGGWSAEPIKRFWPLLGTMMVGLYLGVQLLVFLDPGDLHGVIGGVVVMFAVLGLFKPQTHLSKRAELPASMISGFISGICGGVSTIWGPPISMFLVMTDLNRDEFIRTVGTIWFLSALPLMLFYIYTDILDANNAWYALFACGPAFFGVWVGQKIRKRIPQEKFKMVLMVTLLLIGVNLVRKALFG